MISFRISAYNNKPFSLAIIAWISDKSCSFDAKKCRTARFNWLLAHPIREASDFLDIVLFLLQVSPPIKTTFLQSSLYKPRMYVMNSICSSAFNWVSSFSRDILSKRVWYPSSDSCGNDAKIEKKWVDPDDHPSITNANFSSRISLMRVSTCSVDRWDIS